LSGDCARELFKLLKDLASLQVCTDKMFLVLGFSFFVSGIISGVFLGFFGPLHLALDPNRQTYTQVCVDTLQACKADMLTVLGFY